MSNDFYNHNSGAPGELNRGASATIRSEFDLVQSGFDKMPSLAGVFGSTGNYAVAAGSVNAWTVTVAATVLVAYTDGMQVRVKFPAANTTTTPTMNVNSLGAKSIVAEDGTALAVGNIAANMIVALTYNTSTGKLHMTDTANQSAATATTQAGIATTQAGIATTQAGIATTQAGNASTSATNAEASRQAIDQRIYPGTYAVAPTTKPPEGTGAAIANGDEYFGTDGYTYVRVSGAWVNQTVAAAASAAAALANKNLTDADAVATAADRVQTGLDRTAASASATAALASGKIFQTTTAALSKGVASITQTANGATGTNGTFSLAFSGGAGSGATGNFTVTGGAVVPASVIVTNPGSGYTSSPAVSYAASAGLAGATGVANIADNVGDGNDFLVPSSLGYEAFIVYRRSGASAVDTAKRILNAGIDSTLGGGPVFVDNADDVSGFFDEQGQLRISNNARGVDQRLDDQRANEFVAAATSLGIVCAASVTAAPEVVIRSKYIDTRLGGAAMASEPFLVNKAYGGFSSGVTGPPYYPAYRFPTLMQIEPGHCLLFCCELQIPQQLDDIHAARIMVQDVYFDFKSKALTSTAPRVVYDNRAFTSGSSIAYTIGHTPILQRYVGLPNKGRIWLPHYSNKDNPATLADEKPYIGYSDDLGQTWSVASAFTIAAGTLDGIYGFGTGTKAVQLKWGAHKGRILVPNYANTGVNSTQCVGIYSDDGGTTWTKGTYFGASNAAEPQFAEDIDGTVYAAVRAGAALGGFYYTQLWKSTDGGVTFAQVSATFAQNSSVQAALSQAAESSACTPKMMFAWPNSASDRSHMTVKRSYDGWTTTDATKLFDTGNAGYSSLESIGEDYYLLAYETKYFTANFSADSIWLQAFNSSYIG